jgi:hypothetical protein
MKKIESVSSKVIFLISIFNLKKKIESVSSKVIFLISIFYLKKKIYIYFKILHKYIYIFFFKLKIDIKNITFDDTDSIFFILDVKVIPLILGKLYYLYNFYLIY